jgi:hypothetical protein
LAVNSPRVDHRADDVGRQQVRRELNALKLRRDRLTNRVDGQRLGEAGNTFEQNVPTGEQSDQNALDHHILTDDDLVDLVQNRINESALTLNHLINGTDVVRHKFSLGPSG